MILFPYFASYSNFKEEDFELLVLASSCIMFVATYLLISFQTTTEFEQQELEEAGIDDADDRRGVLTIFVSAPFVAVLQTLHYTMFYHVPLLSVCEGDSDLSPLSVNGRCSPKRTLQMRNQLSTTMKTNTNNSVEQFEWLTFDGYRRAYCEQTADVRQVLYHTSLLIALSTLVWVGVCGTMALAGLAVSRQTRRSQARLFAYLLLPLLFVSSLMEAPVVVTAAATWCAQLAAQYTPWLVPYFDVSIAREVVLRAHATMVPFIVAAHDYIVNTFVDANVAELSTELVANAEHFVCEQLWNFFHFP